jgi:type III restriction enzyme
MGELKLKFEKDLDYQLTAINSIVNIFKGQKLKNDNKLFFEVSPNSDLISNEKLLENINLIQKENNLDLVESLDSMDFSVEMETGTGKTYVYLRTIFELNKKYNFNKFVIVVPSVAIKEGTKKTLDITKKHFMELYDRLPYEYYEYNSSKLQSLKKFASSNNIQIMIMTIDSFNKETNKINKFQDNLTLKPIEYIQKSKPIVILDEPQNMESDKRKEAISDLNPLFKLRYSATHKNIYNLTYKLSPKKAYDLNLVKKVDVLSVYESEDENTAYIKVEDFDKQTNGRPKAKVKVFKKDAKGTISLKPVLLSKIGDDLFLKTDNIQYKGYVVENIKKDLSGNAILEFSNNVKLKLGEETINQSWVKEEQIKQTIKEHFEKKLQLNSKGIKVLTLFFIDKVSSYVDNGEIKVWFEKYYNLFLEEYKQKLIEKNLKIISCSSVQGSYFSTYKDNTRDTSIENDKEMFDLIMKDKEKLLSLENDVEFIFSHSALKEGWDNPNVFNICTLNYTNSEMKKRQELGRGLRLPVNQQGERIIDENINILTVITNQSYTEFAQNLQSEFEAEGIDGLMTRNKRKRITIKRNSNFNSESFTKLWDKINCKGDYKVEISDSEFILKTTQYLNEEFSSENFKSNIGIKIEKTSLGYDDDEKIGSGDYVGEDEVYYGDSNYPIKNLIKLIQDETFLTKKTIIEILSDFKYLDKIFDNPSKFIESFIDLIKRKLLEFKMENLNYIILNDKFNLDIFKEEISGYSDKIVDVGDKKSIYNKLIIDTNSTIESSEKVMADYLRDTPKVKFFLKLPSEFKINTPRGTYNPDWAVLSARENELIFIIETKIGKLNENLSESEKNQIYSAKKFYTLVKETVSEILYKDINKIEQMDDLLSL